ncbi:glycosyltransferase family 4 protein [Alteribacter aurantiacus]|uniref:glycosyltransferase family 4 protein n=1 Tax=Alteribacter aurantiacus TaxID=254410 RepID=UPI0003FF20A3|nr:glycosyltransferase family 4 protein [Alteribacter aurantiacus]
MEDILIIAHYTKAPNEKGNGRFHYIADKLGNKSKNVEVVTSSYAHKGKVQRKLSNEHIKSIPYEFTTVYEPGYNKNVSLERFYSHYIFGRNLKKYLKNRKKPDVIYCAVPSINAAKVAAEYAHKNNIKFIVDVQDLWPEAFQMVFNIPLISNVIFYPMNKNIDYVYAKADKIIAVSKTYSDRALRTNDKCKEALSVFLGTDLSYFDSLVSENRYLEKPESEVWLAYIGTLGHSYDITTVLDALKIIKDKGIKNIKFVVMGDGPLKSKFENHAKENEIYAKFLGRLDYGKMVGVLKVCDIAVNPISKGAAQSIINKHGDYAAAGLPVLNTQESKEYRDLVKEFQMGFNCENNNAVDLADKLLKLYKDKQLRESMGDNSRKLAELKFDRSSTYQEIIKEILE